MTQETTDTPRVVRIAHISDLHFGLKHGHQEIWDSLKRYLRDASETSWRGLDLVLVTGDIVDSPKKESYQIAREELDSLDVPYLVCPGNHDRHFKGNALARLTKQDLAILPPAGMGPHRGSDYEFAALTADAHLESLTLTVSIPKEFAPENVEVFAEDPSERLGASRGNPALPASIVLSDELSPFMWAWWGQFAAGVAEQQGHLTAEDREQGLIDGEEVLFVIPVRGVEITGAWIPRHRGEYSGWGALLGFRNRWNFVLSYSARWHLC